MNINMNLQEEKNKLETLEYFRKEIHDRHNLITFFNMNMESNKGFFARLLQRFKINYKTHETQCSNGMYVNIEIDKELKQDIVLAFEKSKARLEKLYKENASAFMNTVDLQEDNYSSK